MVRAPFLAGESYIQNKKAFSSNETKGFSLSSAAQNCSSLQFPADN